MKNLLEQLALLVPLSILNDRNTVLDMLSRNRIVVDRNGISDKELTSVVMNSLFSSPNFRNDFQIYMDSISKQNSYSMAEGFWSTSGAGGALTGLFSSGLGFLSTQNIANATKASANASAQSNLALAQAKIEESRTQLEIAKLQLEASKNKPQNNTVVYIVIAFFGLLAIGATVFAVTRKP